MENWNIENEEEGGGSWRLEAVYGGFIIWLNSTLNFHRGHFTVPSDYSVTLLTQRDGKICQQNSGDGGKFRYVCPAPLTASSVNDFYDL